MNALLLAVLSAFVLVASATTHFKDEFNDGAKWTDRWVQSDFKSSEGTRGDFVLSHGKFYGDAEADKGLQTSQDARFYAYTAKFPAFSNEGKDLVLQYSVKHEQKIDCGGGYIKILPADVDQKNFNGDAQYYIMFGPDICGSSTKKVHLIFNHDGKNHLIKKNVPCETDEFTHLYTLILRSDNTYEIQIDQKEVAKGSMKEDWEILEPREIKDPEANKPTEWVDAKEIDDAEDIKPEHWDDIAAQVVDPEATKPEDWDDELDGEWEAPQIPNPEYKGAWRAKQIPNPAYKGEWVHPLVANPNFKDSDELYLYKNNGAVGFELWQVKAGTIFDNILITDSVEEANEHAEAHWAKTAVAEKKHKEEQDKAAQAADEAARAAAAEDEDDEEDDTHEKDEL